MKDQNVLKEKCHIIGRDDHNVIVH